MPDFKQNHRLFHNPVEFVLSKIGGTYKMPILWRLKDRSWRFSELKKSLSHISDRMLAKTLKELEEDGFITKEIFAEVPVKTEYSLTPMGERSIPVIEILRGYGLQLMKELAIKDGH